MLSIREEKIMIDDLEERIWQGIDAIDHDDYAWKLFQKKMKDGQGKNILAEIMNADFRLEEKLEEIHQV